MEARPAPTPSLTRNRSRQFPVLSYPFMAIKLTRTSAMAHYYRLAALVEKSHRSAKYQHMVLEDGEDRRRGKGGKIFIEEEAIEEPRCGQERSVQSRPKPTKARTKPNRKHPGPMTTIPNPEPKVMKLTLVPGCKRLRQWKPAKKSGKVDSRPH